jgi:hypothetical protein
LTVILPLLGQVLGVLVIELICNCANEARGNRIRPRKISKYRVGLDPVIITHNICDYNILKI